MSDQERDLTPQQEAEVSRLLADARATEPVPPEVAARLERALVGLQDEPLPTVSTPDRAPASRRRRVSAVLVAAAAVVAVGVGLGQVDWPEASDDSGGDGAAGAESLDEAPAERAERGGDNPDPDAVGPPAGDAGRDEPPSGPGITAVTPDPAAPVGLIRGSRFAADAQILRFAVPDGAGEGEFARLDRDLVPPEFIRSRGTFECSPARWGQGVLVPVVVEGTPAVLALRPVQGESQVVELLQCGTGESLRSTTLPAQ